ncbi:MAG: AbrB/MazE/SpoVT family DNA-binding domain-containing protein [Synergistaceae bacterium]|nr:AbrB/MazE/SpoVT family DNA-binding domain-containing protein [Synergistaceae bacterium]
MHKTLLGMKVKHGSPKQSRRNDSKHGRRVAIMNTETFTDIVKISSGGQITIPGEIQKILGVSDGYRVMFIADGEEVRIVNPAIHDVRRLQAIHSMRKLQEAMKGAAEEAGWKSDDDVVEYIKEIRAELAEV